MSCPERGSASYRAVLALPHARGLFAAALLARLAYGLSGLPLLITIRNGTGSYAVAGLAVSLYGLTIAVLGPARARLAARRPRAIALLAIGYAASLGALAAAGAAGIPAVAAIAGCGLAGLFPPPVGPVMRTQWSSLAPDDARRQRALSLDTAAESTAFAVGPALGGVAVAVLPAPAVLAGCGALLLAGATLLASRVQRAQPAAGGQPPARVRGAGPLRARGFPALLLLAGAIAAAVSVFMLAAVAAWGTLAAGILSALFSAGGVLGGLAYGRRQWPVRLARRPLLLAAGSAGCLAVAAVAYRPAAAGALLLLVGGCADILLVAAYQLVNVLVAEDCRTEAGAWVNTAYNLGVAAGSVASGFLVDHSGPRAAFAVAAAVAGLGALIGAVSAVTRAGGSSGLRRGRCQ
jgi:predicted MFS family arabinose efflux permease